jgi:hypothetical protein
LIGDGSQEGQNAMQRLVQTGTPNVKFLVGNRAIFTQQASCAIGVLTKQQNIVLFIEEVNAVLQMNKPVLLLLKKHVRVPINDEIRNKVQVIRYDDANLVRTIRNINEFVQDRSVRRSETSKQGSVDIVEVAMWTLLGLGAAYLTDRLIQEAQK